MILAHLDHAAQYASLHAGFAAGFAFLQRPDLATIATGRYELDGDRLYVNVEEPTGRGQAVGRLECHRRYIDIQVAVSGNEVIGWRSLSDCSQVAEPYDAKRDVMFFADPSTLWMPLPPGQFAIFFPSDPHAPCAGIGPMRKSRGQGRRRRLTLYFTSGLPVSTRYSPGERVSVISGRARPGTAIA